MRAVSDTVCIADKVELSVLAQQPDLLLIRASTHEARSEETDSLIFGSSDVWDLDNDHSNDDIIVFGSDINKMSFNLRSSSSKSDFMAAVASRALVIDITGFEHAHWAWLVRTALASTARSVSALYVEPKSYAFSESPIGGEFFDLSERIGGIYPLPGFAAIRSRRNAFVFVPLLGFEGTRLTYMIEQVQPNQTLTYPVVGVPGFQLDFPFFTIQGNRRALLKEEGIWGNRRFVQANCPESVYALLQEIHAEHEDKVIKVALIGTKPHALGAVLFKIHHEASVDLIYDHPIRKQGRTIGASNALMYNLTPYRRYL